MIQQLKSTAPFISSVTYTDDMGFEFSAVTPDGVIYAMPGMLLSHSGGQWPPSEWEDKPQAEVSQLMREFLLENEWDIIPWDDLSNEDVRQWFDAATDSPI